MNENDLEKWTNHVANIAAKNVVAGCRCIDHWLTESFLAHAQSSEHYFFEARIEPMQCTGLIPNPVVISVPLNRSAGHIPTRRTTCKQLQIEFGQIQQYNCTRFVHNISQRESRGLYPADELQEGRNQSWAVEEFSAALLTIEQGNKNLIRISFIKLNIRLLLERGFLNFSGYSLTGTQMQANATKRLHKFHKRSHFSRDTKRTYEKTNYSHASSVVSTVTHLPPLKVVRMPPLFIYLR
ncbi:hypothetical protein CSKR_112209 [Clonorchis sinensis]|uniref:Uncharacterized protein n=1 Tax=Clonorchis sinensis TaxID=79923 RepID=A0A419PI13_CLOSI|nr:hypothetical protein CSKR_112209 [Clonorchis sinensis]